MTGPLPRSALAALALGAAIAPAAGAQSPADSATLRVQVRDAATGAAVVGAVVSTGRVAASTDDGGGVVVRLAPGAVQLRALRVGFDRASAALVVRPAQDTTLVLLLKRHAATGPSDVAVLSEVVSVARSGRRVADEPVRVEVVPEEEIAEKVAMTPGDVTMLLAETSGIRVQATAPALGAAGVRVLGLRPRHTLLLADGLPLYGAQAGGFGPLQIPPLDLGRVEVVKGVSSALYGGQALGGVVNLVSRAPETPAREVLANRTSLGGSDAVAYVAGPLAPRVAASIIAGAHGQERRDVDGDAWADVPGYRRYGARPRLSYIGATGRRLFATAGVQAEERDGGTIPGRALADGLPYGEGLRTSRADAGLTASTPWRAGEAAGGTLDARASLAVQSHRHRFGAREERDRHLSGFAEVAARPRRGAQAAVLGAALGVERYAARDVAGFDYRWVTPAAFAQYDVDVARGDEPVVSLSAGARVDRNPDHGALWSPRLSALVRLPAEWTVRLSAGGGAAAPTPFSAEEADAVGLAPFDRPAGVRPERARGLTLDVGGGFGRVELNATAFAVRVRDPLQVRERGDRLALVNGDGDARTAGADVFAKVDAGELLGGELALVATYVFLRATEPDPDAAGRRRTTPLTPRQTAGLDAIWEQEGRGRVGLELYYTGRQVVEDAAPGAAPRPYLLVGLLAERRVGSRTRLFVNAENLGDVRQTRRGRLVRQVPAAGGRRTFDAWAPLDGRVINAGLRVDFAARADDDG